ncbi:MAG: hypothetical protein ACD_9C00198G0003 [uncultured bacterium]|nr:MAG: hypothetical protein ACD_9C00198G0003 [uncultured bacterium]
MKIITISGLDGSGKSTQAKMLQEYFEKQEKKVMYFHAIQFSFAQKLKEFRNKHCLICRFTKICKRKPKRKSVTTASCLQIQLRKIALIIDIIRFNFYKKRLKKEGYKYIISDRYFYDSIVNISYLAKENIPSRLEKYIPSADFAFYLKVKPELIMTRNRVPDQGIKYLHAKKHLYDMYKHIWNLDVIDGSKGMHAINKEILLALN